MAKNLALLPEHLLAKILTDWLECESLPYLDAALCNRRNRDHYLSTLHFKGTVFQTIDAVDRYFLPVLMKWVADRSVRVSVFNMRRTPVQDSMADAAVTTAFWTSVGDTLVDLYIEQFDERLNSSLESVTQCITRLRHLHVEVRQTTPCTALGRILENCAGTLETLTLLVPEVFCLPLSIQCMLGRLHSIRVDGYHDLQAVDWQSELLSRCPNLHTFVCSSLRIPEPHLRSLADHCPQLRCLDCDTLTASTMSRVLASCMQMDTLCFSYRSKISAAHTAAIVEHGHSLRAFYAHDGMANKAAQVQNRVLELGPRLEQLEHLSLYSLLCTTDAPILFLAERCNRLKSLHLHGLQGGSVSALVTLFSNLSLLEELDLSYVAALTKEVLTAILDCCPRLRRISLVGAFTENRTSAAGTVGGLGGEFACDASLLEGVTALLVGCAALREVNVSRDLDPALITHLRALRPVVALLIDEGFVGEHLQARLWFTRWVEARDADSDEECPDSTNSSSSDSGLEYGAQGDEDS